MRRVLAVALAVLTAAGLSALGPAAAGAAPPPRPDRTPFLAGGDITALTQVEDAGAVFRDRRGRARDAIDILADAGVNVVRLRLYTETGPDHPRIGYPADHLPDGYQDLPDVLSLARRAAERDMAVVLTLHYSDYWSNGAIQDIPKDWREATALPEDEAVTALERRVHDYTADVLAAMNAQGTPPAFVALGNEMQAGILFPYGAVYPADGGPARWDDLARFLRAGAAAVRETAPDARIVLHLDEGGDYDRYRTFFGAMRERGVPHDVIGSSYYPYWTERDIPTVTRFYRDITAELDRDVLVMETGINWSPVTADGVEGQLPDNGPVPYPETPQGQRDFLDALFRSLRTVPRVLGDVYWDPVMIAAPGVGWQAGAPNVVSNTTLFDFDGDALPALEVFRRHTR